MSTHYDIIILGGGNAGFGVSSVAAKAGKRVAIVESRDFGGTCPNRGCTPKKILVAAAHALHEIERAKVLVDRSNGQIIGAHLIGHHAEDLIHLFALAMRHGITSEQLERSLYAFPTFSADVKNLL